MDHRYDAILGMRRPVSAKHPPMPPEQRAAQFAPFAALSGYGEAIAETARVTDRRAEPAEDALARLDEQLALLTVLLPEGPVVTVRYFLPDERKQGGSYQTVTGCLKAIQTEKNRLVFADDRTVQLDMISEILL